MTDEELIKTLWSGEVTLGVVASAATRIQELTAKLKVLEKVEMYLKTMYPEKSGSYFICGEGGVKDDNGLPERLHICPAYGADWMMLYTRTDKTSGPEY
jgi:hypothetical protein